MNKKYQQLSFLMSALTLTLTVACSSKSSDNGYVAPTESKNPNQSGAASVGTTSSFESSSNIELSGAAVSSDTARKLVITLAGVNENSVKGYVSNTKETNGIYTYEISFWVGKIEYFYTVSGTDGAVLYFTTVFHDTEYVEPEEDEVPSEKVEEFVTSVGNLSESQAKDVVFMNAGVSANMVSNFKIKDKINGNINEYEITFSVGETSYYYTIMAASGIVTLSQITKPEEVTPVPDPILPDIVPVPSTPVVTTPSVPIPDAILPDLSTPVETPTPETSVPENIAPETATPSTPSATAVSASGAKWAALSYAGISEGDTSRLSEIGRAHV